MTPGNQNDITNEELSEKIDGLSDKISALEKAVTSLKGYIIGDINNGEKVGIAEKLRRIETWIADRRWIEKLFIAGVVAEILGLIVIGLKIILTSPLQ